MFLLCVERLAQLALSICITARQAELVLEERNKTGENVDINLINF